jgi:Fe2+ transport system protein FeoA
VSYDRQIPLSDLEPGQEASIVMVKAQGSVRRRLLEMGFVRGAHLKVEKLAPMGDPMELVIKGYHLSLRREEGACIMVTRIDSQSTQTTLF